VEATDRFIPFLEEHGFSVDVHDGPEVYADADTLAGTDLVVQCFTQGTATDEQVLEAMHASLYRAFFVDGADIGRIDVLVQIGEGVGLDPTGLKVALDIDQQTDRVLADQAEARARGIAAVPALLSGDRQMIGLHHYDAIRELVV
jgi:predicted DsbA family dithiol-disulfide isomerase